MAYLNPDDAYAHLQERVLAGIATHFPVRGRVQSLHLDRLEVKDTLHPDDIRAQQKAKVDGGTWAVPVYAHLSLRDTATGGVLDARRVRVAEIPKTTRRQSYIVDGQEYQVDSQWQLKPGAYVRRRDNGELETRMNVSGRRSFDVLFDPATQVFTMEYGKAHVPMYPLLKTLGVDDAALKTAWGDTIYEANKGARFVTTALERWYKADRKTAPPSREAAAEHLFATMAASKLRPDATSLTLGKPFGEVTGEALRLATEKMLRVQAGRPEDDRDSLVFKDLRTAGDFAFDKLTAPEQARAIQMKALRKVNTAKDVRDVVKFDIFARPLRDTFHKNAATRTATQINPVEMLSSAQQTTIMGPGGIQSERSITDEAKFVNPSHLGFLDPIHTPEGQKTGVTLRLPIGVRKIGREARVPLYSLTTKAIELVPPAEAMRANVVLPDQVRWENGHPVPLSKTVKMAATDNAIREGRFDEAQYVMRHPSQLFNLTSNLIPFLGCNSGNRASMAARHIEQAISLLHREAPLVQVATGVPTQGIDTFEALLGKQASHAAPVDGRVFEVKKDAVVLEGKDGQKREVQLYQHYPLNDAKSVLHSTPTVKAGDAVKAGALLADTNFSKGGTLALGTNLRVAYLPFKGYNFEDGVVISASAAEKLASEHLHKPALRLDSETKLSTRAFEIEHPGVFSKAQLGKLGDDGIVKVGARVAPGDPLVAATKPFALKDRTGLSAIRRSMTGAHTDRSLRWDSDFEGEVVAVHRKADGITVHVRTVEPMQVGDKTSARHGNKGIVTLVLPDREMPHTKDGRPIDVALNPSGVPGRMNVGQVLETAAGKIAEKTGRPYVVRNFEPGTDFLAKVKSDLAAHGLKDKEELFDPVTKLPLGEALVGPQHMLKLVHQVDKKLSVRAGMSLPGVSSPEHYNVNLQPSSGAGTGGQSMGTLGMYALLAHGATANLREMQTFKSEGPDPQTSAAKRWPSQHNDVWAAIQSGTPIPTPKPTFAFQKFTDLLKAAGVNMEKQGHSFVLTPLTDRHILALAKHALPKPAELLQAKLDANGDPKPKPGGLFDEKLTGGHGGRQWSRIALAEPLPNPVFESPIQHLTGLKQADYDAIVRGQKAVTPAGALAPPGQGATGGAAIKALLEAIDVPKALGQAKKELASARGAAVDKSLKRVKYLSALERLGTTPAEAYVLHHLPVLPPVMRPVSVMADGNLKYSDINGLYSAFAQINDKLQDPALAKHLSDAAKADLRGDYYDGVKALLGVGIPYADAKHKGLLHTISGAQPKTGFFQETLMNRRQDLTMRSTIVPEPALGLDEVGLPRQAALDLFRPFVVRQLVQMGAAPTALDAPKLLAAKPPIVWQALDKVMQERPVLMKRDPALHKYSVQAFRPRAVAGNAIQIHPLVTGGFNADFDGDTMSVYVPVHHDAVAEANKMFPSNNLFSEATGKVMYQPTLESALGLYKLSLVGKDTGKSFAHAGDAVEAVRAGSLRHDDVITIAGRKTTAARVLLAAALPAPMQDDVLHNLELRVDKKRLDSLLTMLAKNHAPEFGEVVNRLKDLGNGATFGAVAIPAPTSAGHALAFAAHGGTPTASVDAKRQVFVPVGTHTLGLDDFTTDTASRDRVLAAARAEVDALEANPRVTRADKDRRAIDLWQKATTEMRALHEAKQDARPTNLFLMYKAGIKPGWSQYQQMVLAPMLFQDSANRTLPTPVTRSYAEGLDVGGYWNQMPGARRGSVMKVQEVQEPGYMSKLLMNTMMHVLVSGHDCGTSEGIALPAREKDVHDRFLAEPFAHGPLAVPAGTRLTPDVMAKIRATDPTAALVVRSPLACREAHGVCQKCIGLSASGEEHPLGTNVGVMAAHAVGERGIQLALKTFHTGGIVEQGGGSKLLNQFARFQQLMKLPEKIPDAATLAMTSGMVDRIETTPTGANIWIGGTPHHVGKDARGQPLHRPMPSPGPSYAPWRAPVVGASIHAGDHLSDPNRTVVNPRDLYKATGNIETVRHHLAGEIYDLYRDEGIRRRAVETVVAAMSNLTRVDDPGDHPDLLRGEFHPLSEVRHLNAGLQKESKRVIEHTPTLKGIEMMPLELHEDWMAKLQHRNLRDTILEAAATGGASNLHGPHPVPAMAFGAELGLTSAHAREPGKGHLANVPAHHY
jgi:DNA-directed RNA polymerase subunit beta'